MRDYCTLYLAHITVLLKLNKSRDRLYTAIDNIMPYTIIFQVVPQRTISYHSISNHIPYHTWKKLPYHISWCNVYLRHPSRPVSRLSLTYTLERPGYQIRGNQELSCNRSWQPVTLMNPHLDHSFDQLKPSHEFCIFHSLLDFSLAPPTMKTFMPFLSLWPLFLNT